MSTEIPDDFTVVNADDAAKYISEGYRRVTGSLPTPEVLLLLLAQFAGETGNGKSIHNYNFGNTKRTASSPYWQQFPCGENDGPNGESVMYYPPDPKCHFDAYLDGYSGAEAFVKTLKRRDKWWNGLQTGDVVKFVQALAMRPYAYFTASPASYLKLLKSRMEPYSQAAKKYGVGSSSSSGAVVGALLGLGAAVLFVRINRRRRAA
jgi:hypothetical protein